MSGIVELAELIPVMEEYWDNGKTVSLIAKGSSMSPLLHNGIDSVILAGCKNPQSLKKRDLPLYRRPDGKYVLHRIVKVRKNSFDMCGDSQTEIERNVDKSSVVAVAVGFIRNGKQLSASCFSYKLYAFLWCLVIPLRPALFKLNLKLRGRRKR